MNHLNGNNRHSQASNYGRSVYDEQSTAAKLEHQLRETEQLLEISLLKKKLRETERAMEQIIADIHGKAAKCNGSNDNNVSSSPSNNKNDSTMDVAAIQVRDHPIFFETHKANPNHTSHKSMKNKQTNKNASMFYPKKAKLVLMLIVSPCTNNNIFWRTVFFTNAFDDMSSTKPI